MNINRSNIVQNLPVILEKIRSAHFIALDFEMTGINRSEILRNNGFDTIQQRYWKTKESVQVFSPIQLGICAFKIHSQKKIEASPFNVYLSQYTENGRSDRMYMYSSSAINFLAHYNMNFNEVFKNGVYYFSKQQEEQFDSYKSLQEVRNDIRKQISTSQGFHLKEFLSLNEQTTLTFRIFLSQIDLFMENKRKKKIEFNLLDSRFPSFFKELEQFLSKKYPEQHLHITYDQEKAFQRRKILIQKLTEQKEEELKQKQAQGQKEQLSQPQYEDYESLNYNFRCIIEEISKQKIPIIVHNGFVDILHLYDKFLYNLPEGSSEFKREINKHFPVIFDTKLIVNASQKLSQQVNFQSDLRNCYEKLLKYKDIETQIQISDDITSLQEENLENPTQDHKVGLFSNYQLNGLKDSNKIHEAGYDSLMTGYVFFKSLQVLNILQSFGTPAYDSQIDYFQNRLFLSSLQSTFDIKDFDPTDTKSVDVFYIKQLNSFSPENKVLQDFFTAQLGNCKVYTIGNSIEQEYFVTGNDKNKFRYFEQKLNSDFNGVDVFHHDGKYFQIKTYQKFIQDINKIVKVQFYPKDNILQTEDKFVKLKNMDGVLDQLNQE